MHRGFSRIFLTQLFINKFHPPIHHIRVVFYTLLFFSGIITAMFPSKCLYSFSKFIFLLCESIFTKYSSFHNSFKNSIAILAVKVTGHNQLIIICFQCLCKFTCLIKSLSWPYYTKTKNFIGAIS